VVAEANNLDVSSEWESIDASEFVSELAAPNVITDPFKQRWKDIKSAYQSISNYKAFKTYDLKPVIVKANDDCRQEVIAIQLMTRLKKIWKQAGLSLWLKPYNILITSSSSAMIEFMPDTISIHALKKQLL
jgi:phosphatidylinositol 4-kinase